VRGRVDGKGKAVGSAVGFKGRRGEVRHKLHRKKKAWGGQNRLGKVGNSATCQFLWDWSWKGEEGGIIAGPDGGEVWGKDVRS